MADVFCLPESTFAMNQMNYARWFIKYYNSLIELPVTHPEVHEPHKMDG